jgi:hypothetical protein
MIFVFYVYKDDVLDQGSECFSDGERRTALERAMDFIDRQKNKGYLCRAFEGLEINLERNNNG